MFETLCGEPGNEGAAGNTHTQMISSAGQAPACASHREPVGSRIARFNGDRRFGQKGQGVKMKEFTLAELADYNGKDGKPAYVVHDDKVYDVSGSKLWKGGLHMRRHPAGSDLTTDIQAAPHESDLLARYPQVGILVTEDVAAVKLPAVAAWLLEKNPFFRRHPHPMTVHFPIVFFMANPFFNFLFLLTGEPAFETTAFHCLAGGILFSVVAILTGLFTWWYNYMAKMSRPIAVKLPLSIVLFILAVFLFVWRLMDPTVLTAPQGAHPVYLILNAALIPIVSIIGWYGATMTFPLEKD